MTFIFYSVERMPCGCGKKKNFANIFGYNESADGNPVTWGPPLWELLHLIAERVGRSGTPSIDIDQAILMDIVVQLLPSVIPCDLCQAHCRDYLAKHPFSAGKLKESEAISLFVRQWLLDFHNAVRSGNGQPLIVTTLEQLTALYGSEKVQQCQVNLFISNANYGVRNGLVKMDVLKRWIVAFNKLKIITNTA